MAIYRGYFDSSDLIHIDDLYPSSLGDSAIIDECDDEFLSNFNFLFLIPNFDSFVSLKLFNDGNYKCEIKYIYNGSLLTYTISESLEQDFEQEYRQLFIDGNILYKGTAKIDITFSYLTDWEPVLKRNVNTYFLYTYKSPKNQLTKTLSFVKSGTIKFQNPITHRDLVISMVINANEYTFNYVYLSVLNRFYYIIDTSMMNDIATLTLHEDVLMTFETLIRVQTAFVTRNENTFKADLYDDRIPDLNTKSYQVTEYPNKLFFTDMVNRFSHTYETSVPVILVSGGVASYVGGATSPTDDDSSMNLTSFPYEPLAQGNLTIYVTNPVSLNNCLTSGNFSSIQNLFNDVGEYLVSLRYYPFDVTKFMKTWLTNQNVNVGGVELKTSDNITLTGTKLNRMGDPVSIAKITFSRVYNDFRDYSPYTDIKLYLPYIGFVDLDVNEIMGNTINVRYALDFLDGTIQAYIMLYDLLNQVDIRLIQVTDRRPISIEIPLNSTNAMERCRNLLMGSMGLVSGGIQAHEGNVIGGVQSLTRSTGSFLNAISKHFRRGNIHGGTQALYNPTSVFVVRESVDWVSDNNLKTVYGKPLEETVMLNTLTGYTEIGKINFNPNNNVIYDDEINEIIQLLRDGVIL